LNRSDGEITCDYNGMLNDDTDKSNDKSQPVLYNFTTKDEIKNEENTLWNYR
jgi:hypothetical protein